MMKNCIRSPILGFSDKFANLILVIRFSPQLYNHEAGFSTSPLKSIYNASFGNCYR